MKRLMLLLLVLSLIPGTLPADESCGACSGSQVKIAPAPSEPAKEAEVAKINTSGLHALIQSKVPLVLLDARSGKWDDGERIPGAISLTAESPAEEVAKVIPKKDALVVTYCSNLKCPASLHLYQHLEKLGYTNLMKYPEGIQAWKEAGYEVTTSK